MSRIGVMPFASIAETLPSSQSHVYADDAGSAGAKPSGRVVGAIADQGTTSRM
jgi:hypothetical protein